MQLIIDFFLTLARSISTGSFLSDELDLSGEKNYYSYILENDRILLCPGSCYSKVHDVLKRPGIDICVIISGCIGLTYIIPKVSGLFESISSCVSSKYKELKGKMKRSL